MVRTLAAIVDPPEVEAIRLEDLWIKTKDERLVSLRLNEIQSAYADVAVPNWRQGDYGASGIRHNVLKFRQPGFSTFIDALLYVWTTSRRHFKAWIVAGDEEGAGLLFEMVQRFYDNDARKLRTRYNNDQKLTFPDLDSEISIHTAGKLRLGRGTTINALHLSELAWWDNLKARGGLLQAVPQQGNVFEETTAHGFNHYRTKYEEDKAGRTNFRAFFFSWKEFREYSSPAPADFTLDEEEEKLMERYGLTHEQLQWRREKKMELDSTETPFVQEYPLNDVEAFVASGNPYFDQEYLMNLLRVLEGGSDYDPIPKLVFSPGEYPLLRSSYADGTLRIYATPIDGGRWGTHSYLVTADPSEGIDRDGKHSRSAVHVLDAETWEQAAVLCGYFTPDYLGHLCNELAIYYNYALVGVLRNNHGHAVLSTLIHYARQPDGSLGYPVQRGNGASGVYCYDPAEDRNTKAPLVPVRREPGYPENERTKIIMLDTLQEAIAEDPGLIIYDRETVRELLSYVKLPGGGAGPERGCFGDRVSALALGAVLLNLRFRRKARSRDSGEPQVPRTSNMRPRC